MKNNTQSSILPESVLCTKTFALRNFAAWLCLSTVMTLLNCVMHNEGVARELKGNLILFICCLLGTHLLRMFIFSNGSDAPWRKIYISAFAIGLPLVSFLTTVLSIELHMLLLSPKEYAPHFVLARAIFGIWFFMILLMGGWAGVYISSMAVARYTNSELKRLETVTALREAELRALKAQINPHFLFNSLNTIRALVNDRPGRAQDAVLHLSLLLRAALQTDVMLRPLRDELETVSHYLELEKMRFEERLNVKISVSDDAMKVRIPTMLLQTLVENAVKHGIATAVSGGTLEIFGKIEDNVFRIEVSNPGKLENKSDGIGLGLGNARMRVQRLLGQTASLNLVETSGKVSAILTVPKTHDDQNADS